MGRRRTDRSSPPPTASSASSTTRRPGQAVIDISAATSGTPIETTYKRRGKTVTIVNLNYPSADLHGKLTGELAAGH
ncbi:hypothetical protein AB0E67_35285 [Streptomyces sp. NPDC032161]|uniref:hypothetical protein n=1 Tax=unclassified Streptomyces TaxID=2593676 RepID=UPI0033EF031D